jgi:deoxycytidylate deaminase
MKKKEVMIAMALNSDHHRCKHSALITYKNEVISLACNRFKSHPFQKKFGRADEAIFLHAEISAIKQALRRLSLKELSKSSLYVVRVSINSDNNPIFCYSKPCEGCMRAIEEFDIQKVLYTNEDGKFISLRN